MPNLFDQQDYRAIVDRFQSLSPDSPAKWGKMNVSQMLAHCQVPIQVGLGEVKLKRNLFGILFGKMAKKTVMSDKPFKKSLPTDPSFVIKDDRNFDAERSKLMSLIEKWHNGGAEGLTKEPHPFFGPMTAEEWNKSQYKHLDHHLQQFGV